MITIIRALIELVGTVLFEWWGWVFIVAFFGYMIWQNRRQSEWIESRESIILMLEIPRTNDRAELAAEQMFAALHGILRPRAELRREGGIQEHISFEFAVKNQQIRFYIWCPKHLKNFVEGQVYAQYPEVQIYETTEDYADRELEQKVIHSVELGFNKNDMLPIKTFPNFDVDPLASITGTIAKLDGENEEFWIQILARPIDDSWHKKGERFAEKLKTGSSVGGSGGLSYISQLISAFVTVPEEGGSTAPQVSDQQRTQITAVNEKISKLGYQMKIRILYAGEDSSVAKLRMQAVVGSFKQFNNTMLNGFKIEKSSFEPIEQLKYRARYFLDRGNTVNIEELASIYHLPHTNVETPNIVWANSKTAEPPSNLALAERTPPGELSSFGMTNFRGTHSQFGLKRVDRGRHVYIVGQTGTGKSGLLELLTLSDVFHNHGFAVIDPHGDYAADILRYIPAHRLKDVVYFNPADVEFPIGFNPMEVTDPSLKNHISSELVGVLKRMFESWGPRLEYILRYTLLALLDTPNSTMLGITRMLTEREFRNDIINNITDPVVKNFWTTEFASWNDKFAAEAVAPVLNKVGAFTANPMIRNIIGQEQSTINVREIMDEGKILIVNLSRGLMGEDNAAIMGALMVTKIQLAAMSRANIVSIDDRRPFYLYVDEFQNFATDSFAVILSEARKYGLNLTIANQYVNQMELIVRDAVFGNVGSLISFRVGAEDGAIMQKYFEPEFEAQDLINLNNRHFVANISIDGEKTRSFSATTLNIPPVSQDYTLNIIENSRAAYGKPRVIVEKEVRENSMPKTVHKAQEHAEQNRNPSNNNQAGTSGKSRKKPNKNTKPQVVKHAQKPLPKEKPKTHGELSEEEVISLR
ncbi:DUF87 domain-containing protein [Candidatus Saccharibacteria bacterium]|nr:DUF87 domain-containing protein [Candidatus Saccharibacteria bacterium]